MKPEENELLLKDLCGRLSYGVKIQYDIYGIYDLTIDKLNAYIKGDKNIKPYLRPMSSMTDDEKKEFIEYAGYEIEESVNGRHYEYYLKDFCGTPDNPSANADGVDWLNKNMFDFRGLIPKDLALSTEIYNPYVED